MELIESKNILKSRSSSDIHKFHLLKEFRKIRKTTRWKNLLFRAEQFHFSSGNRNRQGPQMACSGSYHLTESRLPQLIQVPFTAGYEVDSKNPSKLICLSFTFCHLLLSLIWKNILLFSTAALPLSFLRTCPFSAPSLSLTRAAALSEALASWKFFQMTLPKIPNQHLKTCVS